MELTNEDPTLALRKHFVGLDITYMNITDYWLMQSLNVTQLSLAQPERLSHKLPNYSMVDYDSLKNRSNKLMKTIPFYAHLAYNTHHGAG